MTELKPIHIADLPMATPRLYWAGWDSTTIPVSMWLRLSSEDSQTPADLLERIKQLEMRIAELEQRIKPF